MTPAPQPLISLKSVGLPCLSTDNRPEASCHWGSCQYLDGIATVANSYFERKKRKVGQYTNKFLFSHRDLNPRLPAVRHKSMLPLCHQAPPPHLQFDVSFPEKLLKIAATRGVIFSLKFTKWGLAARLRPDTLGELKRTPDPLAAIRGPTSKERGGDMERKGRAAEGACLHGATNRQTRTYWYGYHLSPTSNSHVSHLATQLFGISYR